MRKRFILCTAVILCLVSIISGCSASPDSKHLESFKQLAQDCLYLEDCGYAVEGYRDFKDYFDEDYYFSLVSSISGEPLYTDTDVDAYVASRPARKDEMLEAWNSFKFQPDSGSVVIAAIESVETFYSAKSKSILYRIQFKRRYNPDSMSDLRCALCILTFDNELKVTELTYGYFSIFPEVLQK